LLGLVGVAPLLLVRCGGDSVSCEEGRTCAGAGDADAADTGLDGGGPDAVQPPVGCDPAVDPKDAPACVVNDYGVFVDGTGGNDGNAGTRESPVKTIGGALA
jgi:hypothetical protein